MQGARLGLVVLAVAVAGEAWGQSQPIQRRQPELSRPALAPSVRAARPTPTPAPARAAPRAVIPQDSARQSNFEIQVMTSDLKNAESTPSTSSTPPLTPLDGPSPPPAQSESRVHQTLSNIMKSKQDGGNSTIQNAK